MSDCLDLLISTKDIFHKFYFDHIDVLIGIICSVLIITQYGNTTILFFFHSAGLADTLTVYVLSCLLIIVVCFFLKTQIQIKTTTYTGDLETFTQNS